MQHHAHSHYSLHQLPTYVYQKHMLCICNNGKERVGSSRQGGVSRIFVYVGLRLINKGSTKCESWHNMSMHTQLTSNTYVLDCSLDPYLYRQPIECPALCSKEARNFITLHHKPAWFTNQTKLLSNSGNVIVMIAISNAAGHQ